MDGIIYRNTGVRAWAVVGIGGGHLDIFDQGLQLCEVLENVVTEKMESGQEERI